LTRRYLLDTSVVSSIAPGRASAEDPFLNWLITTLPRTHMSTVSVFEIEQGIYKLERTGAQARADVMRQWLEYLLGQFGDSRMLPMDTGVASEAGRLSDWSLAQGVHPGTADIMIAATASVHGLTLLTYNLKHFAPLGIGAIDPTAGLFR
jgi:predicted nucleic acid-binding protein